MQRKQRKLNTHSITLPLLAMVGAFALNGCQGGGGSPVVTAPGTGAAEPKVNHAPSVRIDAPGPNAAAVLGSVIALSASADDADDGNLTNDLEWNSSISGSLGTGGRIETSLPIGKHTVSARVQDSGGATAEDQVQIVVAEPPRPPSPAINAGSLTGEGQPDIIESTELSFVDSAHPSSEIIYTVAEAPTAGMLYLSASPAQAAATFSQADIDAGGLVYRHRRGGAPEDAFTFRVDNGLQQSPGIHRFDIAVLPDPIAPEVRLLDPFFYLSLTSLQAIEWTPPASPHLDAVDIVSRTDGNYPQSPADGLLETSAGPTDIRYRSSFTADPDNDAQAYYVTLFSRSDSGVTSGGARAGLYCDAATCVTVPDLRKLTRIASIQDVEALRMTLIRSIWGDAVTAIPNRLPNTLLAIKPDFRLPNAAGALEINVIIADGLSSKMRFFTPFASNGKLIIHHQGHRGNTGLRFPVIDRYLLEGFHVLEISMPLTGYNWDKNQYPDAPPPHEALAGLDLPMRHFVEPVAAGLNFLMPRHQFSGVFMVGISGGGWTTVLYSAIDSRIDGSYPVAGSYPFYLRRQLSANSAGDFEQADADIYNHASYLDLYIMGAAQRRQVAIYNVFDDCCFEGTFSNTFKPQVQSVVQSVGGSFDTLLDRHDLGHQYSDAAIEFILRDIETHYPGNN